MQNRCAELKLDAKRKPGEMLGSEELSGNRFTGSTLEPLGIGKTQSHRWQQIASIPEAEYKAYKADAFDAKKEPTAAGALKLAKRLAAAADNPAAIPPSPPRRCDDRGVQGLTGHTPVARGVAEGEHGAAG